MLKINYLVLLKPTQNLLLCFSSVINKILTEFEKKKNKHIHLTVEHILIIDIILLYNVF
jgi:hypothetical protein